MVCNQGSHPTWKTLKTWNFVIFCPSLEFVQKVVKREICKFYVSSFIFKMSFTKVIQIYIFVISTLSTQTLIRSQINLGFDYFYLEITWKIRGILCHQIRGNPGNASAACMDMLSCLILIKYSTLPLLLE